MNTVTPEILNTTLASGFTALMWVPIIINRLAEMGVWKALKNPEPDVRLHADWAYRLSHAHRNAVENLVVFAPLALAVSYLGLGDASTAAACWLYLVSRIAHAFIYTLGIPLLRTIAFLVGFGAQMLLALRILGLA